MIAATRDPFFRWWHIVFCGVLLGTDPVASAPLDETTLLGDSPATVIIHNAVVRTMNPKQPRAEAVAIRDGWFVAVGTSAEVMSWRGPETLRIDAEGHLVLPGFNDSHVHFLSGGQQLSNVDLRTARTVEEFRQRIARFVATKPKGSWITGGDWDHENWPDGRLPTRGDIDSVTLDHPVLISRLDGHMALANSLALKIGGVEAATPDPPGGVIVRDAEGNPAGVLKDAAMSLVATHIPAPSTEQRLAFARAATEHAASLGITSVQDMSGGGDVPIYQELLRRGELKTRIYAASPLPLWQRSAAAGLKAAVGDAWLRQGALKGYADGSLGSTTALFFEPYRDAPDTRGIPSDEMVDPAQMAQRLRDADRAGLHLMVHAIGDRAIDSMLSLYEDLGKENGPRDRRLRIEHAQHIRSVDFPRFKAIPVIASMQPYHCADDGRWAAKRIGPEELKGTYAFRSLLDHGATLAFGSDWNVAPLDPILGVAAAVTRRTNDGKNPEGWIPEQKITVEEAVRAYTVGSAYAEFQEEVKGQIAAGMLADCVILSQDIFEIDPTEIEGTVVLRTFVDGREVYRRQESP